jgi:hypothetical protein
MIEQGGRSRLRKGYGPGMIRFVWSVSPPNGAAVRFTTVKRFVGSVNEARGAETVSDLTSRKERVAAKDVA